MAAYLPLIVALLGLILYLAGSAKVARLGEIMFFCGLLSFCMKLANEMHRLF